MGHGFRLTGIVRILPVWSLFLIVMIVSMCVVAVASLSTVRAQSTAIENPQPGSIGVEGAIGSAAPTRGATITVPQNGQTFSRSLITVSGLCPDGLLVKVFSNNVFVGAAQCVRGSYSIQADLFVGRNDLVARVFDDLDQAGPDSNVVSVTFNDPQFLQSGLSKLLLTSNFARRGANPSETLTWPIILSGGTPPYAISVDWGDGKQQDLLSRSEAGTFDIRHIYDNAGVYTVTIKATDRNGQSAFLQVVGAANGAIAQKPDDEAAKERVVTRVLWEPTLVFLPLIGAAFWLGRRYELAVIRKHLERQ